jgi:DNA-binding LacI/PurR family transcriptional regulator
MPTVIFEQHTDVPVASVTSDNEGAAQVARHLLGLGHRRLAMLTGVPRPGGERRFEGFLAETSKDGLEVPLRRSDVECRSRPRRGRPLLADERPTAVFAANDVLAVGVLLAAQDMGLRVPNDLSAGFDDFDFDCVRPALTSVSVDFRADGHVRS